MASGRGRYLPADMVVACADQAVVYANRAQSGDRLDVYSDGFVGQKNVDAFRKDGSGVAQFMIGVCTEKYFGRCNQSPCRVFIVHHV